MNPLLIEDIFIQICYYVSNINIIIKMEEISKWHVEIIRKNKWLNLPVHVFRDKNVALMVKTHNFNYINLNGSRITNVSVHKLPNVHTLKLAYTKITDVSRFIR